MFKLSMNFNGLTISILECVHFNGTFPSVSPIFEKTKLIL